VGIDVDRQTLPLHGEREPMPARVEQRARHLDGSLHGPRQLHAVARKAQRSARDACHVEQVVDQAHHVVELALDHTPFLQRDVSRAHSHQLQRRENGGEWISELVAEDRQEFILGAIGLFRSIALLPRQLV
jgi:hypothetical protein